MNTNSHPRVKNPKYFHRRVYDIYRSGKWISGKVNALPHMIVVWAGGYMTGLRWNQHIDQINKLIPVAVNGNRLYSIPGSYRNWTYRELIQCKMSYRYTNVLESAVGFNSLAEEFSKTPLFLQVTSERNLR